MIIKHLSISQTDNKNLLIILILMLVAGILEVLSLGAILPVFQLITKTGNIEENIIYIILNKVINLKANRADNYFLSNIIIFFFVIIFFVKNFFLVCYSYFVSMFAFKIETKLSVKLYDKYVSSSIIEISNRNSSEFIRNCLDQAAAYANNFILMGITIAVELITFLFITTFLLIKFPFETLVVCAFFCTFVIFYILFFKKKIYLLSKSNEDINEFRIRSLQEGIGAIKELKIFDLKDEFLKKFFRQSFKKMRNTKILSLIRIFPRYFFEIFAVLLISFYVLISQFNNIELTDILPQLTLFAIATLRIIPSLNRIITSSQRFKLAKPIVENLYNELIDFKELNLTNSTKKINFVNQINLKNISFIYPGSKEEVFFNLNLIINKNTTNFIYGESGSGKSTLVEIILGLIKPNSGEVLAEDKNIFENIKDWQNNVGYVPQRIFLINTNIKKNIILSEMDEDFRKEDFEKIISDCNIENLDLNEDVGENAKKLSLGQIQRVGIARALYKKGTNLIVFDEITSSLDEHNTAEIMSNIKNLSKNFTILFISHDKNLSKYFENKYELKNKQITLIKD